MLSIKRKWQEIEINEKKKQCEVWPTGRAGGVGKTLVTSTTNRSVQLITS